MSEFALLAAGCAEMGLVIDEVTQQRLLDYLALLQKWNKVYNLTAVRDPKDMVVLHLLDSLSVMPYVESTNLLDVGSGGGLPGIVLAIVNPHLQVTTIDTVQKKAIFMRQVKGELGLNNLEVVHGRVEAFKPTYPYAQIISRAFSEIDLFMQLTQHLIAENGKWLAMKGLVPEKEVEKLNKSTQKNIVPKIVPLKVATLEAERHLLIFENQS